MPVVALTSSFAPKMLKEFAVGSARHRADNVQERKKASNGSKFRILCPTLPPPPALLPVPLQPRRCPAAAPRASPLSPTERKAALFASSRARTAAPCCRPRLSRRTPAHPFPFEYRFKVGCAMVHEAENTFHAVDAYSVTRGARPSAIATRSRRQKEGQREPPQVGDKG
eukprot:scaffold103895_cov29-Tisochrysis_lutea.AAC.5